MKKLIVLSLIFLLSQGVIVGCKGGGLKTKTCIVNVLITDDSGNALSGVNLTMAEYSGVTDSKGKYTFKNVEAGDYTIEATKEGFNALSSDITLNEGETKNLDLILSKKVLGEELKDYTTLKSYKAIIENKTSTENQKIEILQDDYGKKQRVTITDLDTKEISFELHINGDKAKVKSGEEWIEMPAEQAIDISKAFLDLIQIMATSVRETFNTAITTPQGSVEYNVSRVGGETVNGYSTIKYLIKAKITEAGEKTISQTELWVISSGEYKDYPTRMLITIIGSDGETETMKFDILDYGKTVIP